MQGSTMDEEIAHPARLASVAKLITSVAYLAALFFFNREYPQLLAGIVFVPFCVLAAFRHARALTLSPLILLTPRDLYVCWWDTVFMVPWVFRKEERIPWTDLERVEVNTLRVNGMDISALRLHRRVDEITIEPGVFAESARDIATRITSYRNRMASPQSAVR